MMLQPPAQAFPSCRRERVSASVRPYGWRGIFPVLGLALAGCLAMQGPARAQEKVAKTSMIELYTSQGCKSCPRADRNFARYANDPHVLALSFHVNYWDYMGWRDTLATQENADRQTAYRRAQKARMVYTPQAIIDGRTQVNGRDMTAIEAQTAHRRLDVPVSIRQIDSNRLSIEIGAGEHRDTGAFTLLMQDDTGGLEVQRKDGEWIGAPPVKGAYVINIGNVMMKWTNGRFVSTMHRVVNRALKPRYSIPFFANPDYDVTIAPIAEIMKPGEKAEFEPFENGPYMRDFYDKGMAYLRKGR